MFWKTQLATTSSVAVSLGMVAVLMNCGDDDDGSTEGTDTGYAEDGIDQSGIGDDGVENDESPSDGSLPDESEDPLSHLDQETSDSSLDFAASDLAIDVPDEDVPSCIDDGGDDFFAQPECGDGLRDYDEECDDGLENSDDLPDACRTSCLLPSCGDTVVDTDEECDDGDEIDNNDCSNNCEIVLPDLCSECETDDDCGREVDRCLDLLDGRFCGIDCAADGTCPANYECVDIVEAESVVAHQCAPRYSVCSDCVDLDGDEYGVGEACAEIDCDENSTEINPGATDSRDGLDNNCDGLADEGTDWECEVELGVSLVDNDYELLVPCGARYEISGARFYEDRAVIAGYVRVQEYNGDSTSGTLKLSSEYVEITGVIDGNGVGESSGPGAGATIPDACFARHSTCSNCGLASTGCGGSYGGRGDDSCSGETYGTENEVDIAMGSGGGRGGRGGGLVAIQGETVVVRGIVSVEVL